MGTFAVMLGPNLKSREGCDYGNKPIDLPFQIWHVVEFSTLFAARPVPSKKSSYVAYYIYNLFFEISFSDFSYDNKDGQLSGREKLKVTFEFRPYRIVGNNFSHNSNPSFFVKSFHIFFSNCGIWAFEQLSST